MGGGGAVAQRLKRWTVNQENRGSSPSVADSGNFGHSSLFFGWHQNPDVASWGAMAYRLESRTLSRENPVSNPTAVASNLWQV